MAIRAERVHFITCDGCGVEHHDPAARTALEARIKAGVDGWKYRASVPGTRGKGRVSTADACPACDLPPNRFGTLEGTSC